MPNRYVISLLSLCLASMLTGCVTSGTNIDRIRERHAAEFGCEDTKVNVKEISFAINRAQGTYSADGCGARGIYVCDMGSCIRNSQAEKSTK